jgi:hypothetical protein
MASHSTAAADALIIIARTEIIDGKANKNSPFKIVPYSVSLAQYKIHFNISSRFKMAVDSFEANSSKIFAKSDSEQIRE